MYDIFNQKQNRDSFLKKKTVGLRLQEDCGFFFSKKKEKKL